MEQYLERIGYTGDRTPNLENLSRLVRCHLETVPFENLDCLHNPTVFSLNLEDLLDKVVTRRRGGVCCELNTLFNALLTYLGYDAYSIMVRITMRPGPRPITHQCVITVLDGKKYYCDVGFGGPGPKGLVCLETEEVQNVFGEEYTAHWDGVVCIISKNMGDGWMPLLQLIDVPGNQMDFEVILTYCCGTPTAHFVNQRSINLCHPGGGFSAIMNNTFYGLRNGEKFSVEVSDEELPALLEKEFGLVK